MNRDNEGFTIIQNRMQLMHKALHLQSINDRIMLLESYVHDIQDCLYWIKKEREIHE